MSDVRLIEHVEDLTAEKLADALRDVPLDMQLDAIGLQLDSNPDAAAIVSGWMLRMMNTAQPVTGI